MAEQAAPQPPAAEPAPQPVPQAVPQPAAQPAEPAVHFAEPQQPAQPAQAPDATRKESDPTKSSFEYFATLHKKCKTQVEVKNGGGNVARLLAAHEGFIAEAAKTHVFSKYDQLLAEVGRLISEYEEMLKRNTQPDEAMLGRMRQLRLQMEQASADMEKNPDGTPRTMSVEDQAAGGAQAGASMAGQPAGVLVGEKQVAGPAAPAAGLAVSSTPAAAQAVPAGESAATASATAAAAAAAAAANTTTPRSTSDATSPMSPLRYALQRRHCFHSGIIVYSSVSLLPLSARACNDCCATQPFLSDATCCRCCCCMLQRCTLRCLSCIL